MKRNSFSTAVYSERNHQLKLNVAKKERLVTLMRCIDFDEVKTINSILLKRAMVHCKVTQTKRKRKFPTTNRTNYIWFNCTIFGVHAWRHRVVDRAHEICVWNVFCKVCNVHCKCFLSQSIDLCVVWLCKRPLVSCFTLAANGTAIVVVADFFPLCYFHFQCSIKANYLRVNWDQSEKNVCGAIWMR